MTSTPRREGNDSPPPYTVLTALALHALRTKARGHSSPSATWFNLGKIGISKMNPGRRTWGENLLDPFILMDHIKIDHSDNIQTVIIVITSYHQPLHFRNFLHNPFQTPSKLIFPGTSSNILFKSIPAVQKKKKKSVLSGPYTHTNNLSGMMVSRYKMKAKPQQYS